MSLKYIKIFVCLSFILSGSNWIFAGYEQVDFISPTYNTRNADDEYGANVYMDEDYVIISAPNYDYPGQTDSGIVEIYAINHSNNSVSWLQSFHRGINSNFIRHFGKSFDRSGDYMVISGEAPDNRRGTINLFKLDGSTFNYESSVSGGYNFAHYGYKVAIYGNFVFAREDVTSSSSGFIRLYEINTGTDTLNYITRIRSDYVEYPYGLSGFGDDFDPDDGFIVIGAQGEDNVTNDGGNNAGAVYLYLYDSSGFTLQERVMISETANQRFGRSVSTDNDIVIVGCPFCNLSGTQSGAVYVYEYDRSGDQDLDFIYAFENSELATGSEFGTKVEFKDNFLAISGNSSMNGVFLYTWNPDTRRFGFTEFFSGDDSVVADEFGNDFDIYQNKILVGAKEDLVPSSVRTGSAYLFEPTFCPLNRNLEIDMSENIVLDAYCDLRGYNISFTGTGNITFNATYLFDDFENFGNGDRIYLGPEAHLFMNTN